MIYDFKTGINQEELDFLANELNNNELVIFPTETVYGIGALAYSREAVAKIFEAKGRASDNPLIVHVSDQNMLKELVLEISPLEQQLIDTFMPGPFTLILKHKNNLPTNVTAGLDTVGIRIPDHEIAINLIKTLGAPIAAPSANISSRPSGTIINDIHDEFKDQVKYFIDGGKTVIGLESTVVKVINGVPVILRPGFVTKEMIEAKIGECLVNNEVLSKPISPGTKYKHYAPNTKCIVIYNKDIQKIHELINKYKTNNTVIIGKEDIIKDFNNTINYGNSLNEIASNLFTSLRQADRNNSDLIIIVGVEKTGLGVAIMERMLKASSNLYYEE